MTGLKDWIRACASRLSPSPSRGGQGWGWGATNCAPHPPRAGRACAPYVDRNPAPPRKIGRVLSRLALALASLAMLLVIALAALGVIVTASGVLDRRPGAWTVPVTLLPGVTVQANVAGLARLATSPIGLALLDGRRHTTRRGPVNGHLAVQRDGDTLVLRCAPCRVQDPRLAARPVALPPLELRATRRAGTESNRRIDLRLALGAVEAEAVATLAPEGIELAWTLPPTEIAALYRALADAVPEAKFARIEGRLQASGTLALPTLRARNRVSIDGFEVGGLGTERLTDGWFAFGCRGADESPRTLTSGEGERGWLDAEALGTLLPAAVLTAEDQRFATHPGYDPVEITQALAEVDLDGEGRNDGADDSGKNGSNDGPRALRGASTITQQLARTLHTGPERTAARKLRELLYAVEMERTLGKERILLLYLNTVHWGPGLCGARAAARTYFNKRPNQLTPLEAAWLAASIRRPNAAHAREFATGTPQPARAHMVLQQMRSLPRHERERAARQTLVFARPRAVAIAERGTRPVP